MLKISFWSFFLMTFFSLHIVAQVEEEEEEEDYSMYDDYETDESVKRYNGPKVKGLSPAKLVSLGYDFAGSHDITGGRVGSEEAPIIPSATERADFYHGLRLNANLPIISTHKLLINVGANYGEARYQFSEKISHPLHKALYQDIRTAGLNTTIFKPLNEKHYLLGYYMAEYSGDYKLNNLQSLSFIKHSWLGVFGWKFNDRFQFGVGATQSYRAGEVNYFPIIMYNYTSESGKWGIESLLPARGHFRYKINSRNLFLAGFDLEGTSYHLSSQEDCLPETGTPGVIAPNDFGVTYNRDKIELRRSEIRINAKYERAITDFIWISAQVGYALNYRSDVDSGEFFRGFLRDIPYVMENQVGGAPYVQFSINLVSP